MFLTNGNCISMCRPVEYGSWCKPKNTCKCCDSIKNEKIIQVAVAVGDGAYAYNYIDNYIDNRSDCCIPGPGTAPMVPQENRIKREVNIQDKEKSEDVASEDVAKDENGVINKTFRFDMDEKDLDIKISKDGDVSINGEKVEEE